MSSCSCVVIVNTFYLQLFAIMLTAGILLIKTCNINFHCKLSRVLFCNCNITRELKTALHVDRALITNGDAKMIKNATV